jgi:hypothetical protein
MEAANDTQARAQGWTPSMGTFGVNTYPTSSGGSSGASSGAVAPASSAQLAAGIQSLLGAAASGNKDAINEAIREFNQTFGLDTNKFNDDVRRFNENLQISQAGLTGAYQGQQTQAAQLQAANIAAQAAGLTGTFGGAPTLAAQAQYAGLYGNAGMPPAANQTTLAAQQQAYTQQMGAIQAAAALQANPFRQAQVMGQAGRVLQGLPTAGFQAPNTVTGVGTMGGNTQGGMGYLQQMIDDIKSPQANQQTAESWLNATPTPNKLDSASFLRSTPTTQNLILQSMQEKYGIDPTDSLQQIKNTLPQFNAPNTVGTIRR